MCHFLNSTSLKTKFETLKRRQPHLSDVNRKKLKVKLHNGKNSYYIENDSFHEDQVIENVKDLFTSDHETPLLQDNIETAKRRTFVINEIGSKTD